MHFFASLFILFSFFSHRLKTEAQRLSFKPIFSANSFMAKVYYVLKNKSNGTIVNLNKKLG